MGVTGLLPQLKAIQTPKRLEAYRGKTLAVDTYGWLHRALISCARELCLDLPTRNYITSVENKVKMLRHFGVEPYLVFDGAPLPTKAETARERRERREEARKNADDLTKKGNAKLAWKEYMKAAGVTSQMAKSIMLELDRLNVKYVVAPYEADPQMVYLEKLGLVDGILSEDSDLFVFGCRTLITKLDDYSNCVEICRDNFSKVTSIPGLQNFTPAQLRLVAMLSGCDYTKGVPGVGIKTAFNLVGKYNNLEKVVIALRSDGKPVPAAFLEEVHKADLAFQYQKVFNPLTKQVVPLNGYPQDTVLDMSVVEMCCGMSLEPQMHVKICNGDIHPMTYETLYSREQSLTVLGSNSVSIVSTTNKSTSKTIKVRNTIDTYFSGKAASFPTAPKVAASIPPPNPKASTKGRMLSPPKQKVSPLSKKIKSIHTEQVGAIASKFFMTNPPKLEFSASRTTVDEIDLTGDSEVPDSSSPVRVDPKQNFLDDLTDDDLEPAEEVQVLLQKFDVDEEDEVIDESPVKKRASTKVLAPSQKVNSTEFVNSSDQLKKMLATFRCDSNTYVKRPDVTKRASLARTAKESVPATPSTNTFEDSFSSVDLEYGHPEDLKQAVPPQQPIRSASLSQFAFKG